MKPCCGSTAAPAVPATLAPNASMKFTVSLKPNNAGPLQHDALLMTDAQSARQIEIRTTADVVSSLELLDSEESRLSVTPDRPALWNGRVVQRIDPELGATFPPIRIEVPHPVEWGQPATTPGPNSHLLVKSHPLAVTLNHDGTPRARRVAVEVSDGAGGRARRTVDWSVDTLLRASPSTATLHAGDEGVPLKILIHSEDRANFSISGCDPGGAPVTIEPVTYGSGLRHLVEVRLGPTESAHEGIYTLVIHVDHKKQPWLRVPLLILK